MTIHIESLEISCIIGILDLEREREQRVIVDIDAQYLDDQNFVDYSKIVESVVQKMKKQKYLLIEDALIDLKSMILNDYKQITKLKIKISKPDIIKNCTVAVSQSWTNKI